MEDVGLLGRSSLNAPRLVQLDDDLEDAAPDAEESGKREDPFAPRTHGRISTPLVSGGDATVPELAPISVFRRQVERWPLLAPWQEVDLARRVERGDAEAWERLVVSNLRLVLFVAGRAPRQPLSYEDRVQAGAVGLMEAARRFDYRMGYRFSTFAARLISRAIWLAVDEERGKPFGISTKRARSVRRAERELRDELGREPAGVEVAARLGISELDYRNLEQSLLTPIHVDSLPAGLDALSEPPPERGPAGFGPDGAARVGGVVARQLARNVGRIPSTEPILEVDGAERYSAEEIRGLVEGYLGLYDATLVRQGRHMPIWLLVRMADLDDAIQRMPEDNYLLIYEHGLIGHSVAETGALLGVPRSTVAHRYKSALKMIVRLLNDGRSELGQPWIERPALWRLDLEEDYWIEERGRSAIRDAPYGVLVGPFRVRWAADATAEELKTLLISVADMAIARHGFQPAPVSRIWE